MNRETMGSVEKLFPDAERFTCEDGAELFLLKEETLSRYDSIRRELVSLGFAEIRSRELGGTLFSVFRSEDPSATLYLSFSPKEKRIRAIRKENAFDVWEEGFDGEKRFSPLLTQVFLTYFIPDCGMSYLIRLEDGRFVVIDGGFDEFEEAEHLWELILRQNERGGKPVIAAWFVSHAHDDHFGVPTRLLEDHGGELVLQNLIYNWAIRYNPGTKHYGGQILELAAAREDTHITVARSGERFSFGNADFDVLFVGEDLYPEQIASLNNTSMLVRMQAAGKTVLFPGDMEKQAADFVCSRYDEAVLRCDVLQVAHHGYYGASENFYRCASPEILFWPCPDYWYPVVKEWGANPLLLAGERLKAVFVGGRMEKTLALSEPLPHDDDPFRAFAPGETVYEESFSAGRRVSELGWSCLTGGETGYHDPAISPEPGECVLDSVGNRLCVFCFVRPGVLRKNPDYTLTMKGQIHGAYELCGLFYDYDSPTVYAEERVLRPALPSDAPFALTLRADSRRKKAFFSVNGGEERELPYETVGGLHLILRNTRLSLFSICVERN